MVLPLLDASHYLACIEKGIALCQRLETFETATPARRVPLDTYDCTSARLSCHDEGLARGLASVSNGRAFAFVDVRNRRRQEDAIYSNWFSDGTIVAGENYKRRTSETSHPRPYGNLFSSLVGNDLYFGSPCICAQLFHTIRMIEDNRHRVLVLGITSIMVELRTRGFNV